MNDKAYNAVNLIRANVAQFLSNKRRDKGISIRELNRLSGVSTAVISDLENNKTLPSIEIIVRLAFALDIELENLIYAFATGKECGECRKSTRNNDKDELSQIFYRMGLNATQVAEIHSFIQFKKMCNPVRKCP